MNSQQLREWARQKAEESREYEHIWDEAILENELREKHASITDEQLAKLFVAAGYPMMATPILMGMPNWRQAALNFHDMYTRALKGDEAAQYALAFYKEHFSTDKYEIPSRPRRPHA